MADRLMRSVVDRVVIAYCWNWVGRIDRDGYGRLSTGPQHGYSDLAHRLVYELVVGPIPAGQTLDHLCGNTACVHPDHLEPVTARENSLRAPGSVVWVAADEARRTHCPQGHPYDEQNTYRWGGMRYCRACKRIAQARREAARRTNGGGQP